jgi:3-deoxy-7-phosphoheptulonate synthase/chorismate mutase
MQKIPAPVDLELRTLRKKIDSLNHELLDLLQRRAEVVLQIADLKLQQGLRCHDPGREREMLQALTQDCGGPFSGEEIEEIFTAVFRASLQLQVRRWPILAEPVPETREAQ